MLRKLKDSKQAVNLLVIGILIVIFSLMSPYYFSLDNFQNIALQSSIVSIVALGAMVVLIGGAVDLSSGSIVALCMVSMVILIREGLPAALVIAIVVLIGTVSSLLNSVVINYLGINPFLVTLGTMYIFRGLAFLVSGGKTIPLGTSPVRKVFSGYLGFFPIAFIYVVVAVVIMWFVLSQTSIGRQIYATGSNEIAASLSGINTKTVRTMAFILAGVLYTLAALIAVSRIGSGTPGYGETISMEAMASTILGGTSFMGGSGTAAGTLIGAILIVVLMNGLTIVGVNSYIQMVIKGLLIIFAVFIDLLANKKKLKN